MGERAKIIRNGGGQAVRLPKFCCLGAWREDIPRPRSVSRKKNPFDGRV